MRPVGKLILLISTIFLIACLTGCGETYAANPNPEEKDPDETGDWFNIKGYLVAYPTLVNNVGSTPTGSPTGIQAIQNPSSIYQAQAVSRNLLFNPNFAEDGRIGAYTGNWCADNWDQKIDLGVDSPGDEAPLPKSLFLPKWEIDRTAAIQVSQCVPVEAGKYYYLSWWAFSEVGGSGSIANIDLYGDYTGSTTHGRLTWNTGDYYKTGKKDTWSQQSLIFQIPSTISNYTEIPYMSLRLRQNNADSPPIYYAGARIFMLDNFTLTDGIGLYPKPPASFTDPKLDFSVKVIQSEGGRISANPVRAKAGQTITLSATPDSQDYPLKQFVVNDADGNPVTVSGNTFVMPAAHVAFIGDFERKPSEDDWYNIAGYYLSLETIDTDPEEPPPSYTITGASIASEVKYQGQASTYNYLYNHDFNTNGQNPSTGYVGNWASNLWEDKADFTVSSPLPAPPAPKCLYLPGAPTNDDNSREVMQRVPIDSDSYYYASVWAYKLTGNPTGNLVTVSLYGDDKGTATEAYSRVNLNMGALNNIGMPNSQWYQISFIVKIPDLSGTPATAPHLDFRFKQSVGNGNTIPVYLTFAEVFKLFPGTVKAYTGEYGSLPGSITDPKTK